MKDAYIQGNEDGFTQQKVNQIMKLKVEMNIIQKNIFETLGLWSVLALVITCCVLCVGQAINGKNLIYEKFISKWSNWWILAPKTQTVRRCVLEKN